jgi:hypothetical protein
MSEVKLSGEYHADVNALMLDLAALREELAELEEEFDTLEHSNVTLKLSLAAAEQRNAVRDIEAAAKVLANCMDYPWEHMPENGRVLMRKHAKCIVDSALAQPTESGASEAERKEDDEALQRRHDQERQEYFSDDR